MGNSAISYLSKYFHQPFFVYLSYTEILLPPLFGVDQEQPLLFCMPTSLQLYLGSYHFVTKRLFGLRKQLYLNIYNSCRYLALRTCQTIIKWLILCMLGTFSFFFSVNPQSVKQGWGLIKITCSQLLWVILNKSSYSIKFIIQIGKEIKCEACQTFNRFFETS